MDVESGMSGKNRNAVHFNPAKGKRGGAGSRRGMEELTHFRTAGPCLIVSPPLGHTEHSEPQAAKFNKTISEPETQETTSSEKQNGKIGSVHRKNTKRPSQSSPLGNCSSQRIQCYLSL